MLISMTPNDEVKTIHASLNDGSLRKWEFEPYTENGKIELTDQDYATIRSIKGNTVKFNQQVDISIVPLSSVINGITYNRQTGEIKATGTASNDSTLFISNSQSAINIYNFINGHAYYLKGCPSGGSSSTYYISWSLAGRDEGNGRISIATSNITGYVYARIMSGITVNNLSFKPQVFDLTAMGIDNLTTVEQVETWLSNNIGLLPYYDYTLGSLISFNATGLKTENASQTESNTLSLPISTLFPTGMKDVPDYTNGGTIYDELSSSRADTRIGQIVINGGISAMDSQNKLFKIGEISNIKTWSLPTGKPPILSRYETLDLESSRANDIDSVTQYGKILYVRLKGITSISEANTFLANNPLTILYELAEPIEQDISLDLTYPVYNNGTEQLLPVNGSTPTTSSMKATIEYPDRTEEVNFLYKQTTFESAIPQFSLVCKNQELPMTLNDGKLICECDSSITNESGFFDAKVKMQDLDSVAYSQKIQLHVERGIND